MCSFFRQDVSAEAFYCALRDGVEEPCLTGRAYVEKIWKDFAAYVDSDADRRALCDFASIFWELHLAHALTDVGKCLLTRRQLNYVGNRGPDFRTVEPNVWIECVVPRAGSGPNAPKRSKMGVVYAYDPDPVILRLRSVIEDKSKKLRGYINDGVVKSDDSTVIAISGIALPFRFSGRFPPEIVRAVYPANNPMLLIDRITNRAVDSYLEYRDTIEKIGGAQVATDVFLRDNFQHISAVLYGESDWVNRPEMVGSGFVVVHNENATAPLPDGWFPRGDEYWWREGLHLESKRHT